MKIPTTFHELYVLELVVRVGPTSEKTGPLPLPVYMQEIDSGLAVLNEIYREHDRDVARNVRRYFPSEDPATWARNGLERVEAVLPRELYRTCAYVMYATSLEGVVAAAHDDLMTKLTRVDAAAADALRTRQEPVRAKLKDAWKPLKRVRDKVFAHTAFAKPMREEDTASMRYTSLQYMVGYFVGWGPEGLAFGGANVHFDDEPSPELPAVGVSWLHRVARAQFDTWKELIREGVATLGALPDADILRADDRAVAVKRRKPAAKP